jgi:hypothetical protein
VVLLVVLGVVPIVPVVPVVPRWPLCVRLRVPVVVDGVVVPGVPIVLSVRVPVVVVDPIGSMLVLLPVELVVGLEPVTVDPSPVLVDGCPGVPAAAAPLAVPVVPTAPVPVAPPGEPPATCAMAGNAMAVAAKSVTIRMSTLLDILEYCTVRRNAPILLRLPCLLSCLSNTVLIIGPIRQHNHQSWRGGA